MCEKEQAAGRGGEQVGESKWLQERGVSSWDREGVSSCEREQASGCERMLRVVNVCHTFSLSSHESLCKHPVGCLEGTSW